jgi:hypothetical protein
LQTLSKLADERKILDFIGQPLTFFIQGQVKFLLPFLMDSVNYKDEKKINSSSESVGTKEERGICLVIRNGQP